MREICEFSMESMKDAVVADILRPRIIGFDLAKGADLTAYRPYRYPREGEYPYVPLVAPKERRPPDV